MCAVIVFFMQSFEQQVDIAYRKVSKRMHTPVGLRQFLIHVPGLAAQRANQPLVLNRLH